MPSRNLAIVAVTCLFLGALGGRAAAVRSLSVGQAASGCSGPVTHDSYDGYQVGVPAGWSVFHIDERLVVTPTATSPEESVVAAALLTKGLTPARFFASSMQQLEKQIAAVGNAMSYRLTGTSGGIPQASLTGRAGKTAVSGHATVLVLPDQTAHGSEVAVLSAYWAPPAQLNADGGKLAAVGLCYRPEQAPLFRVFQDHVFTYAIPPGFRVSSEGQDSLLIAEGDNAWASFLLTLLPASDGVSSVQGLQQYLFAHEGIKVTDLLDTSTSTKTTSSDGAVNQLEDLEFTGVFDGLPVHGLVSVEASVLNGVDAAGTMRLALTRTSSWNSTSGAVIRIAGGIEHSFSQDIQQWERLSQQEQQFGQQVQGFDQALNGEDLVHDAATGQTFEAPYNSYLRSGPNGPGYYTGSPGSLQKLQIITPT